MTLSPPTSTTRGPTQSTTRFPASTCALAVILTFLALAAAALNLRWGAASPPDRTEALDSAWLYVHTMLVFQWLVAWPAIRFAKARRGEARDFVECAFEGSALAAGSIPAFAIAAFLAASSPASIGALAVFQASLALFAGGIVFSARGTRTQALAAGMLAALAIVAPIAAYFWAEFFPAANAVWTAIIPALIVNHAARHTVVPAAFWWVTGIYAALGLAMGAIAHCRRHS